MARDRKRLLNPEGYGIGTRLDVITSDLNGVMMLLKRARSSHRTKAEKDEAITAALDGVRYARDRLSGYHNALGQHEPLGPDNPISLETWLIKEDIGKAQYLIANGRTQEAAEALQDIKRRL